MSFNLIDAAKGLFGGDLLGKASSYLGESENSVSKAMGGILPALLGGIADKTSATEGANMVSGLAQEHHSSGIMGNIAGFFGTDGGGLLNKGASLLGSLFGDSKAGMLTNLISGFAGIKSGSASSLMSMAAPALLGFLGKHAADNNLNAGGLASMLGDQKKNIAAALPTGLSLGGIFSGLGGEAKEMVSNITGSAKSAAGAAAHHAEAATEKAGGAMKWLLPLLLLALAAAAFLYFTKGCGKTADTHAAAGHDTSAAHSGAGHAGETPKAGEGTAPVTAPAGKVDSTGNFVYDEGEMVSITLPNNAGELKVGRNSTEFKLFSFLNDKNSVIDTVKGNWFEFTNVRFKTSSSELTEESMTQLKNLVAISKAYPTATFKFGGYTDNTGSAASNVALSQKRADAVAATTKKLGAAAGAIVSAKGYGPEFPIGDNATAEGKAMNRRVAVNVKSK